MNLVASLARFAAACFFLVLGLALTGWVLVVWSLTRGKYERMPDEYDEP